jgi:hypothetical protein
LSLGQDEHLCREADSGRASAEKPEQDEGIVEEIGRSVARPQPGRPATLTPKTLNQLLVALRTTRTAAMHEIPVSRKSIEYDWGNYLIMNSLRIGAGMADKKPSKRVSLGIWK